MSNKKKLTLEEKLLSRKIKKPNFGYNVLGFVWKVLFMKKYNIHITYKQDPRKEKEPHMLIGNHASRLDYIFMGLPLLPNRYNFVSGHNEFYRSHLAFIFRFLQVIPKKNFVPDLYTIKQVSRVIKKGGNICILPEGMSSISGHNQPVAVGTGKFIKHFGIPVYYSLIQGGYLSSPKYNVKDRLGHVDVTFDLMFSKEDIEKLTPEEIEDKINELLYQDDYQWNKEKKYEFKANGDIATNLHDLLYYCPKCGKEFTMEAIGDEIKCKACGNGAKVTSTYELVPFNDSCVIPETQTKWFDLERENVKKEIQNNEFYLEEEVDLGMLPKDKYLKDQKTSNIVGKGIIRLDHNGFTYKGTKDNEAYEFHINLSDLPTYGMCTDVTRFYTFYKGAFVEFYPHRHVVEKWFLATEELHRMHGGKWQDFKFKK